MLTKALTNQGSVEMVQQIGDILDTCDLPIASIDNSGGNVTLTGKDILQDLLLTGGVAPTETLPTADQIIAALQGALNKIVPPANSPYNSAFNSAPPMQWPANLGILPPNSTFRRVFRNANSGTATLAAPSNAGVTISGTATIATSKWREYVARIKASAPSLTVGATTTNADKWLTNIDKSIIKQIQVGMSVYGTGIGASAVVDAVDYDNGKVHVTVNSSATADNIGVTFTPTVEFVNLRAGDV